VGEVLDVPVFTATKKREFHTGEITGLEFPFELDKDRNYLVVDDIADGGGTFRLLAKELDHPRELLDLWVTHGVFSGRANELRDHYGNIYTTDSHPGHNRIDVHATVVPVETYMYQHIKEFG
jgi:ribose-phosphate pyrophosphokinase